VPEKKLSGILRGYLNYVSYNIYAPYRGVSIYNFIELFFHVSYTFNMPTDNPKLLIVFTKKLLSRIEDFRYENRIPNRSEAIRRLIENALERYEKKKPKG
jgi:hypothetical protein